MIESAMYWWLYYECHFKWFKMQILFYVMCILISNEVCIGCCFACSMFNAHCLNDKTNCVSGFARIQWLKILRDTILPEKEWDTLDL